MEMPRRARQDDKGVQWVKCVTTGNSGECGKLGNIHPVCSNPHYPVAILQEQCCQIC